MRRLATLALGLSFILTPQPAAPQAAAPRSAAPPPASRVESITRDEVRGHVFFLASDYLGGRRPDDAGFAVAAEYGASQFKAAGVRPAITDAEGRPTYFQRVPLMRVTTIIDSPFTLRTPSGEKVFESLQDLRLVSPGPSVVSAPIVFLGYGISEPDHGWDDVKGIDLTGKVAVMLIGTPRRDGKPVLPDAVDRNYQSVPGLRRKALTPHFRQKPPLAVVFIADREHVDSWDILPTVLEAPQLRYRPGGAPGRVAVPPASVIIVRGDQAAAIFAGQSYSPADIERTGLAGYTTFELKGASLSVGIRSTGTDFESMNVVGVVPGTDPAVAGEYVTLGAHLDHVNPAGGQVRNGADDNASGSAGVLEIAEAVALRPFRRPVLFALWTAEESGLLGSRHFLESPPVPVDGIIVNITLDMIGRSDAAASATRKHYVIGSAQVTPELRAIIERVNTRTVAWPLDFTSEESSMQGSDHYNFHRRGIPTAFFFSGRHDDLHTPADDADKIDFEKAQRLAQLVYEVSAELGNRTQSIRPASAAAVRQP